MISFDDYRNQDLLGLAEMIARRDISAAEAVEAAVLRAEAVNPKINAVAEPLFDQARREAETPRPGPFFGAPFVMKDLNHPIAGVRMTGGSRAFADYVAADDAPTTRRYRGAGLIFVATSTTPEFGLTTTTESVLHGLTRNPWNLERSAGGSSGGSAALVAAGVVPAAHATDGGGSIRVPAACCGLVGLKPSRGRAPVAAGRTESWSGLGVSHAVTRSVRDSAALLDAVCGLEPGSRYAAPGPDGPFLEAVGRPPPRLRIAVQTRAPSGGPLSPDARAAVDDAAALLADLGHRLEEAQPDLPGAALGAAMGLMVAAHTAFLLDARAAELGRAPFGADELEESTLALYAFGREAKAGDLLAADQLFMSAAATVAQFMEPFDAILGPTLGEAPAPLGALTLGQPLADYGAAVNRLTPFTALQNQTGQPAISLPLHWTAEGLPLGVQIIGKIGAEALLLALGAELEAARPWFHRTPPL